jgi:surfactin synthase thioesterase subunit
MAHDTPWLVRSTPRPSARVRLFCFPHAGGGTAQYSAWSRSLGPGVEVWAARLPGRESRLREQPLRRLAPLADGLFLALRPFLDRPFGLFGHSLGGLLAFEVARRLQAGGSLLPRHLFVAGRAAPQLPVSEPLLHALPEERFLEQLRRRSGGVPAEPELLRLLRPALRADVELLDTYAFEPGARLECPITAFWGMEDRSTSRDELSAWREQTSAGFELVALPGAHFPPPDSVERMLRHISNAL